MGAEHAKANGAPLRLAPRYLPLFWIIGLFVAINALTRPGLPFTKLRGEHAIVAPDLDRRGVGLERLDRKPLPTGLDCR